MGPAQATTTCMKKYATTSGRAMRSEFWWFWLLHIVAPVGCIILAIGIATSHALVLFFLYSSLVIYLATITPTYCAVVRRFHDTGRTGKHSILFIITVLIFAFVVFVTCGFFANSLSVNAFSNPSATLYIFPTLLLIDAYIFWIIFAFVLMPLLLIALILFVILALKLSDKSQPAPNQYGPNPSEVPS